MHITKTIKSLSIFTLLLATAAATGACSSEDDPSNVDISDTALSGAVGGQNWTFAAGHTSAFLSEGSDTYFATLYPESFETCGFLEPGGNYLIVSIPKQVGEYEFSLGLNMTFVVGEGQNLISTTGKIVVDEVADGMVRGGLYGVFDGENEVNGRFEVAICDE